MAQPAAEREQEAVAQEAPPPESKVAAAAAAAAAAALLAGTGPSVPGADAIARATKTLLDANDVLFKERRRTFIAYVAREAQRLMPGMPPDRVSMLAAEEMQREAEFQRKAMIRLEHDIPEALATADPRERALALMKILEREKRYLAQREQAAAQRVVAALEADTLKKASPQGAYWQLSPLVREHCVRCVALSGKFWPWEVLEANRIPMHPNCACRLLSLDEAVHGGLMVPEYVTPRDEAIARARMLLDHAGKLEEAYTHEELQVLLKGMELEVMEASIREMLRWGKGVEHGGEFRPGRGGDPGAIISGLRVSPPKPGRMATIKGQEHFVPKGEDWEKKIGGAVFSSPYGTTRLYKGGILLDEAHKDLAGSETHVPGMPLPQKGTPSLLDWSGKAAPWKPPPEPPLLPGVAPRDAGHGLIPDYSTEKLKLGKSAGGSTGAKWAFDKQGNRWLVKTYRGDTDRVATELLANAVYREMGAKVPKAGTYYAKQGKQSVVALTYETLPGETRRIGEPNRDLGRHYMTDALVANWDFVGLAHDNVLWGPNGKPARLDQGGTFQFRAQGALKPYGPVPSEVWTMRSAKGQGFDTVDVSENQMRQQARRIAQKLPPERVSALVNAAPFADERMAAEVEEALNSRVAWMRRFGDGEESLPQPLVGSEVGQRLGAAQRGLGAAPEQVNALARFMDDEALQRRMQTSIREGRKLSLVQNQMRLGLDNLLYRSQTPEDLHVYRTIDPAVLPDDLGTLVGKVVKDKGFGIATSSRLSARQAPAMVELHVPAGASVLHTRSVEGVSAAADDARELLLPRGTRMRVKKVEQRQGRPVLHAVVVG